MSISSLFIHRPIATSLLALAVLIGGWLGFSLLPIAALPQVDFPTIQVMTQLPGANPAATESLLTAPLERQFGQIPSLTTMTSTSAFGLSQITLQFDLNRDIDAAAQDVQAAINAAGSALPRALPYPPVYSKVNPADAPILTFALTSPTVTIRQLSDLADTVLAQRLAQISGVGRVAVQGGVRPAVRIQADLMRLSAYGLSLEDVRSAISNANVNGPKGYIDGATQAYTISANDQLTAASAYEEVPVAYRNNAPVRLKDVADIVDGLENDRVAGFFNGQPAVVIDILRQPGANVVQTVQLIEHQLPLLRASLPDGVEMSLVSDRTDTIRASINDVEFTLILAIVLVVLVVFVFLRSVRATLIAGVALPLSLVATFGVMYFFGFSLDNLSLMALTIGTGFVVDDAIVMIENIARHIEEEQKPFQAALSGAKEIGFTVVSLTVSLIAVFMPLLFMSGLVGRMFREFALTLTVAVVVSAIVSLTLTPMMCAWILKAPRQGDPRVEKKQGAGWWMSLYRASLEAVLNMQTAMLLFVGLTLAATVYLYLVIPKGFLPTQDTGVITAVGECDPTVSFDELMRRETALARKIGEHELVENVTLVLGVGASNSTPNTGKMTIVLKPREQRSRSATDVIADLQQKVADVPGIFVTFQSMQDIAISTRVARARYQYTLMSSDAREVALWGSRLRNALQQDGLLQDVTSETREGGAEISLNVDRTDAGRFGVSMQNVSDILNDAFGQRQVSTIYAQTNQYRVILEVQPRYQNDPRILRQLYVAGTGGTQVPLSSFTQAKIRTASLSIGHQDQFPSTTLSFDASPGASLGDAVKQVTAISRSIGVPASILGSFSGDALEFARALAGEPLLILAAIITIYIVLGVLYESAIHPITILSTLPSAGVGALLALQFFHMDLSILGLIGIVLLMGIVKKNAIMMIDFALEAERGRGMTPRQAIVEAAVLRFRPIMMTTLAALFGAIPLALGQGTGSELRIPLGVTIIGGLLLSQLLTLYSTPVIYLTLERWRYRLFGPVKSLEDSDGASPSVTSEVS